MASGNESAVTLGIVHITLHPALTFERRKKLTSLVRETLNQNLELVSAGRTSSSQVLVVDSQLEVNQDEQILDLSLMNDGDHAEENDDNDDDTSSDDQALSEDEMEVPRIRIVFDCDADLPPVAEDYLSSLTCSLRFAVEVARYGSQKSPPREERVLIVVSRSERINYVASLLNASAPKERSEGRLLLSSLEETADNGDSTAIRLESLARNHKATQVLFLSDEEILADKDGVICSLSITLNCARVNLFPFETWRDVLESGDLNSVERLLRLHGNELLSFRCQKSGSDGLETSLHVVAAYNFSHLVGPLIQRGALINVHALSTGMTPLQLAAFLGHEKVVIELLNRGASGSARTRLSILQRIEQRFPPMNALEIAVMNRRWAVVKAFSSSRVSSIVNLCEAFIHDAACVRHDVVLVKSLLENGFAISNALLEALGKDTFAPMDIIALVVAHGSQFERGIRHQHALFRANNSDLT